MGIHKQCVPGLSSRGGGWGEANGGVEYDIKFESYAVTILTSGSGLNTHTAHYRLV